MTTPFPMGREQVNWKDKIGFRGKKEYKITNQAYSFPFGKGWGWDKI